jgi:hypothetical protein
MRNGLIAIVLVCVAACKKTGDNQYEVVRPGLVTDTVNTPAVTTRTDTVNTPTVGTEKDTIIVNKPVIGTKKSTVKVPVAKKP